MCSRCIVAPLVFVTEAVYMMTLWYTKVLVIAFRKVITRLQVKDTNLPVLMILADVTGYKVVILICLTFQRAVIVQPITQYMVAPWNITMHCASIVVINYYMVLLGIVRLLDQLLMCILTLNKVMVTFIQTMVYLYRLILLCVCCLLSCVCLWVVFNGVYLYFEKCCCVHCDRV